MICEKCKEQGLKSTVRILPGTSTLMYSAPFYDENGVYHDHDPNHHSGGYRCSNGHQWRVSYQASCPNCDYGGNKEITWMDNKQTADMVLSLREVEDE